MNIESAKFKRESGRIVLDPLCPSHLSHRMNPFYREIWKIVPWEAIMDGERE